MTSKNQKMDRRARIAEARRAEHARETRNRFITIGLSVVVVAGLVGYGSYALLEESDKKEKQQEKVATMAKQPISAEKSWDAKKLGRNHVQQAVTYPMKPPVGGDHNQVWMNCDGDVYEKPVPDVNAVHSLEHGAVWVTYNEKAPKADVKKLGEKVEKTTFSLMSPVPDQAGAIMLSAWGKQLTVDSADDPRVDQFFTKYVRGAQTPEPGAPCTNGMGEK
ncbi:DUF3105 domain-containing protein [Streptomyces sp. NPDC050504]|uniref:DUF3105 domain-containing protein n=1 Tax=Streptomyces sp. NPDC050504 TaxID=3365618 RepID=UPI0037B86D58